MPEADRHALFYTFLNQEDGYEHKAFFRMADRGAAVPFAAVRFCRNVAKQILKAPENGTVEVDATPWPGFQRRVFEALAERPDVTLIVTVSMNGEAKKLTVPAGLDLLSTIGNAKVTAFEDLGKLLG